MSPWLIGGCWMGPSSNNRRTRPLRIWACRCYLCRCTRPPSLIGSAEWPAQVHPSKWDAACFEVTEEEKTTQLMDQHLDNVKWEMEEVGNATCVARNERDTAQEANMWLPTPSVKNIAMVVMAEVEKKSARPKLRFSGSWPWSRIQSWWAAVPLYKDSGRKCTRG